MYLSRLAVYGDLLNVESLSIEAARARKSVHELIYNVLDMDIHDFADIGLLPGEGVGDGAGEGLLGKVDGPVQVDVL